MKELKPRIHENGMDYVLVGDYYVPDLKLPEIFRVSFSGFPNLLAVLLVSLPQFAQMLFILGNGFRITGFCCQP